MIEYQQVKNIFQAKSWLINGWNLFKKKPLTWVFMVLIFNIFIIVSNSFFIGRFIAALFFPVLAGGIFIALDKSSRDEPIGLENLFSGFKNKPILKELFTVGLIGVAVVTLTLVLQYLTGTEYAVKLDSAKVEGAGDVYKEVSEGSFFNTIVSVVWSCALLFSIPLIAVYKESAIPALKHSLKGLLLNIIPIVVFFGMILLLTIVSVIPVGLGLLVLIPVLYGAVYSGFKEIYIETEQQDLSEAVTETVKTEAVTETVKAELVTETAKLKQEATKESVVYTNNKKHQEADLKKSYKAIRTYGMVGMVLIAIGVIFAAYSIYSLQIGTNTMGEVLSVQEHERRSSSGSGTTTTYTPTFSFTDTHGEQHTATTRNASSSLNYPVGSRVKINYNPDDYSTVRINSVRSIILFPMILWLVGGAFIWITKNAKKNIGKNGVASPKPVLLKQSVDAGNASVEKSNSQNIPQDTQTIANNVAELGLPKKLTVNLYDDYMHITLSWFGVKTIAATFIAISTIGFAYMFFFSGSSDMTITGSPLMIQLFPWISTISAVGILYYTLTTWLNKTHIFVSQNAIEVKLKPLPWFGNKRLETKNVKQLYSKEVMSTSTSGNRRSSYGLHIISFDEKDMKLLNVEKSEQALFIEQQIEKYLGIKDLKVRGEVGELR